MKINQIFFFNGLACANSLWVHLARQWKSWPENFKKETSWYRGQVYSLSSSNFSSTDEGRGSCGMEWETWLRMGTGRQEDFLNQDLCQGLHRTSSFAVFATSVYPPPVSGAPERHRLCTWAWVHSTGLHKPQHHEACLHPSQGSTAPSARCPQSTHRLPQNSPSRRWQTAFLVRAATCQTPPQAPQRITLTTQNPVPDRVYNFVQTYHLLSQISYPLTLQMSVSPLSDRFLCLYSSPTHGEKYFVVTELSVLAKLGADEVPTSVCTVSLLGGKAAWLTLQVDQNCQNSLIPRKDVIPQ